MLEQKFGGMLHALSLGAPPHGGIAPGIDRIVMLLCGEENLREVVLFPMNQRAEDLMMGAPSEVTPKQLRELHIRLGFAEEVIGAHSVSSRHARPCAGHPTSFSCFRKAKAWMAGTSPAMTKCYHFSGSGMNSISSPGTLPKWPAFHSALACSMRSLREDTKFHQMWRGPSIGAPPTMTKCASVSGGDA